MTTVVAGVRLEVGNKGAFVGDLKEIRAAVGGIGEAERETAAASGQLASATGAVAASAATAAAELVRAATAANENSVGLVRASGAANQFATMAAQLRAELDPMFAVQQRYDHELARADALFEAGAISGREYAAAQQLANDNLRAGAAAIFQNNGAQEQLNRNLGLQRAGWQGVGFQLQDVFASYASGSRLTVIAAQQAGQLSSSIAMIAQASEGAGGKMGAFASFMGGPWGIAIGVAVSVVGALAVAFDDSARSADAADDKIWDYAVSLSALEKNARLVQAAMDDLRKSLAQASPISDAADKAVKVIITAGAQLSRVNRDIAATKELLSTPSVAMAGDSGMAMVNRLAQLEKQRATIEGQIKDARQNLEQIRADGRSADLQQQAKNRLSELEKKDKSEKPSNRAATLAARRAEYSEDVGKKIAGITDQFSDLPSTVTRANTALRELNDIATDLAARPLTPNVEALIEQLGRARTAVEESLNRPFNEYLEQAREAAEIDKLLLQGRDDEARALQIILDLKEKQRPLDDEQVKTVLETVRGERERAMVLRDQRALISANVAAVQDFRGALVETVADALRGRFSLGRILNSFGDSYVNLVSQKLVEAMFGDTLRKLEAQATGADKVDAAGTRIATSLDDGAGAVTNFAETVREAISVIEAAKARTENVSSGPTSLLDQVAGGMASAAGVPESTGDEIVVTANKPKKVDISGTGALLIDLVNQTMRRFGFEVPKVLSESLKGVFDRLEKSLPNALKGAFIGNAASRIVLGDKGVGGSIGSAIGGALGGKVGEQLLSKGLTAVGGKLLGSFAGPIGSALGGVLGGLIGGAFRKVSSGGASIGLNSQGQGAVTGTAGNSADLKKTASGYGGTVISALDQIAQALGADLGNFSVAIGKRSSGYIKVDSTGNAAATTAKKRGANIIYDGKDEGEAIMAALADAIGDGAIKGVSAAVQKALTSSKDVDKAVKEALKVQQVELAIGGIGAELAKAFKDFERQASERVRIARQYGFDVTKLEAVNAKDRLKLQERLLKEQVGSLQDLITELTSGSLFEGSAVDLRAKLLEQIAGVRAQAAAGEEGAADKLAQLLQQLNSVSRDAFATTGTFAADRAAILDISQSVIAEANKRIDAAKTTSDPALAETNTQLNEANDQLARIAASLGVSVQYLQKMSQNWTFVGFDKLAAQVGYR